MVLLHGGVGSSSHWVRNVDALTKSFHVTALDLPGYGNSPDVARDITPDAYVDWVGVNFYSVLHHNNDLKQRADQEKPAAADPPLC